MPRSVLPQWLVWLFRPRQPKARVAPPRGTVPVIRHRAKPSVREALKGGGHVTINREVVRSRPEKRIADFLFRRGVRYLYEPDLDGATPDFYLPDSNIIVEHWGMRHTKYIERRMKKVRMYRSRGYVVVETEREDVARLERVLELKLLAADPDV